VLIVDKSGISKTTVAIKSHTIDMADIGIITAATAIHIT